MYKDGALPYQETRVFPLHVLIYNKWIKNAVQLISTPPFPYYYSLWRIPSKLLGEMLSGTSSSNLHYFLARLSPLPQGASNCKERHPAMCRPPLGSHVRSLQAWKLGATVCRDCRAMEASEHIALGPAAWDGSIRLSHQLVINEIMRM